MDPSPAQLRALLAMVGGSLVAVLVAIVALVRSGRSVPFPEVRAGEAPQGRSPRRDHVTIA